MDMACHVKHQLKNSSYSFSAFGAVGKLGKEPVLSYFNIFDFNTYAFPHQDFFQYNTASVVFTNSSLFKNCIINILILQWCLHIGLHKIGVCYKYLNINNSYISIFQEQIDEHTFFIIFLMEWWEKILKFLLLSQ